MPCCHLLVANVSPARSLCLSRDSGLKGSAGNRVMKGVPLCSPAVVVSRERRSNNRKRWKPIRELARDVSLCLRRASVASSCRARAASFVYTVESRTRQAHQNKQTTPSQDDCWPRISPTFREIQCGIFFVLKSYSSLFLFYS